MGTAPLPRRVVKVGRLFQFSPPSVHDVGSPEKTLCTFGLSSLVKRRSLTLFTGPVTPATLKVR